MNAQGGEATRRAGMALGTAYGVNAVGSRYACVREARRLTPHAAGACGDECTGR